MCVCVCVCVCDFVGILETRCELRDVPHHWHVLQHLPHNCGVVTRPISWATECDTEIDTEGGWLGGHRSAVKDGVLLGKREAGERSVTGRGPHIFLSFGTT